MLSLSFSVAFALHHPRRADANECELIIGCEVRHNALQLLHGVVRGSTQEEAQWFAGRNTTVMTK